MQAYTLAGPKVNAKAAYRDAQEAAWRTQHGADVARDAALRTLAAAATERYAGEQVRISKGLVIALNHGATLQADGTATVQSQTEPELVYTVNGHCDCPDATHGAPDGRCKHRWAKTFSVRALALAAPVETLATLSEQLYGPQAAAAAAQRTACGQPDAEKESRMDPVTTDPEDDDATLQAALAEYNAMAGAQAPRPTAPAACPEAMFSLTLKGLIDGQDAQLTVRGQTAEAFLANVTVARGLFDAKPAPSQQVSTAASQQVSPPPAAAPALDPTSLCTRHQVTMEVRHGKDGRTWHSHLLADGSWCKGK